MDLIAKQRVEERVSFASLTANNLGTIRKLNSVLFPVNYSDKVYSDILLPEVEDFCKLIYLNDIPVGTVCCRIDTNNKDGQAKLYLMTMGILGPYRSRSIGSQALEKIFSAASLDRKPKITSMYLHVQTSNTEAKRFYEGHGFKESGIAKDYYKKITPHDAWIMEREINAAT